MSKLIEIWKPVAGFIGKYEVSNLGRVKSLSRKIRSVGNSSGYITRKEQFLKPASVWGYLQVVLMYDGKRYNKKVHRLVAEAFVDGHFLKAQINHIDGNKKNNNAANLEWCTSRHNVNHSVKLGLRKGKKRGASHFAKKVIDTNSGRVYDSIVSAAEAFQVSPAILSYHFHRFNSHRFTSQKVLDRLAGLQLM